jgi:hypothetical protein
VAGANSNPPPEQARRMAHCATLHAPYGLLMNMELPARGIGIYQSAEKALRRWDFVGFMVVHLVIWR